MTAIKFGVCGIDRIGAQHCRFFSQDRGSYKLVALCDLDSARVSTMMSEFGGKGYSDFAKFLADPEMELVIIAIPSLDHARNTALALAGPYCTIYGDRGTLIYEQDQRNIHIKYLNPKFRWPEATADPRIPALGKSLSAEQELPWIG